MSRTFLKFFQGFSLFLCPPGLFRCRSSDSLHMIPPQDPFVKHFLTKTDSYFWIFLPETGVHDWRNPQNPLLGEGGPAEPGRVWGGTKSDLVPPLFRRCGGTFSPRGRLKPSPAWRGWTGGAGTGVEGTPESSGWGMFNETATERHKGSLA